MSQSGPLKGRENCDLDKEQSQNAQRAIRCHCAHSSCGGSHNEIARQPIHHESGEAAPKAHTPEFKAHVARVTGKRPRRNMDLTSGLCHFHSMDLGFNYSKRAGLNDERFSASHVKLGEACLRTQQKSLLTLRKRMSN